MKKYLFSFIVLLLITLYVSHSTSYAQYGQYGQPAPSYSLLVDKLVGKPNQTKGGITDYTYVDNLSPADPRFRPGQEIFFKIKVKNTATVKLTNVTVKDYVPSYLEPIEGPGTWDANTRTITWNAGDFNSDEEKVYYIKMQIYPQDKLPANRGLFCLVNKVGAYNQASDEDTAQFCIEKEVLGVTKVPEAGPAYGLALLAFNGLAAIVGFRLKKLANI